MLFSGVINLGQSIVPADHAFGPNFFLALLPFITHAWTFGTK